MKGTSISKILRVLLISNFCFKLNLKWNHPSLTTCCSQGISVTEKFSFSQYINLSKVHESALLLIVESYTHRLRWKIKINYIPTCICIIHGEFNFGKFINVYRAAPPRCKLWWDDHLCWSCILSSVSICLATKLIHIHQGKYGGHGARLFAREGKTQALAWAEEWKGIH